MFYKNYFYYFLLFQVHREELAQLQLGQQEKPHVSPHDELLPAPVQDEQPEDTEVAKTMLTDTKIATEDTRKCLKIPRLLTLK